MLINIIDVGQPNTHAAKNGRSYQSIEVTYKAENGQVSNKKLMSFSNPTVFNHIKDLTKGATLNVTTTKDAAGYWQWTGIGDDNTPSTQETKPASGGRVTGSNYETKEERAARQVFIIRQSSISSAVELVAATSTEPTTVDNVINIAKKFEAYVLAKEDAADQISEDDIPA